jgi:rubrerythrin
MKRLSCVAPPYSQEVTAALEKLSLPGMAQLALFRTLAHNPRVLQRIQRGGLLDPGSISVRLRELTILRSCALCRAEYEWGVHAKIQKDPSALLQKLIELDYDAVEAYNAAIQRVETLDCKETLRTFRDDHLRHIAELGSVLRQSGVPVPQGANAKSLLTKGKVVIAGLVGERAVLLAMKTNEEDTNTAYERAVNHDNVAPNAKELLRSGLADERRHRAWLIHRIESES